MSVSASRNVFHLNVKRPSILKKYISVKYKEKEYFQEKRLREVKRASAAQVNTDIFKLASRMYHFLLLTSKTF